MKLICKSCDRILEEEEFDMWFPAIKVRKEICKSCERKQNTKWMVKELRKQQKKKPN